MDKAQLIHDEIQAVLEGMGLTVEIDRDMPPNAERPGFQSASMWTGDEDIATDQTTTRLTWDRRWTVRPVVEIYLQNREDPQALRPLLSSLWSQFLDGIRASKIEKIMARDTFPDIKKMIDPVQQRPDILIMSIEMAFTFDR